MFLSKKPPITTLLISLCVVLVLILWLEYHYLAGIRINDRSISGDANLDIIENIPAQSFDMPDIQQYSEFIDRPLFVQTRRPVDTENISVHEQGSGESSDDKAIYRLLGVLITDDSSTAYLRNSKTGKLYQLKIGDTIDEWQLTGIKEKSVTLRAPDNQLLELPLWVDNNGKMFNAFSTK